MIYMLIMKNTKVKDFLRGIYQFLLPTDLYQSEKGEKKDFDSIWLKIGILFQLQSFP